MDSQRISISQLAINLDVQWRKYFDINNKYYKASINSFDFALLAKMSDVQRKKYIDMLNDPRIPEMVKNLHYAQRSIDLSFKDDWKIGMKKMEKKKQERARMPMMRRWAKVKAAIKNKDVLKKCSDDSYSAYIAD